VNDLTAHPLRVANEADSRKQWQQVCKCTSRVMHKLHALHEGGINEEITYKLLEQPRPAARQAANIMGPLQQSVDTTVEAQSTARKQATCLSQMLAGARKTLMRRRSTPLPPCTLGPKMVLRQQRHNTAALAPITEAIRHGRHSGCYIHMDGKDPCNPHDAGGMPSKALMTWLIGDYQQTSFPDIVVVVGRDDQGNDVPCEGRPAMYLVEIKYTEDWNVHAVAQGVR
jgi:hypothetical protein